MLPLGVTTALLKRHATTQMTIEGVGACSRRYYAVCWNGHDTAAFGVSSLKTVIRKHRRCPRKGVPGDCPAAHGPVSRGLKTAVRKLTHLVQKFVFNTDVALVQPEGRARFGRPTGEAAVRVLKKIHQDVAVKPREVGHITSLRNGERGSSNVEQDRILLIPP